LFKGKLNQNKTKENKDSVLYLPFSETYRVRENLQYCAAAHLLCVISHRSVTLSTE